MESLDAVAAAIRFSAAFRSHAWRATEYSFDARPGWHGTMVAGGPGFFDSIAAYAGGLSFAADWLWQLRRFVAAANPDSYLFRVDWFEGVPRKLTAYCRFPVEPDAASFDRAVERIGPTRWTGPSTDAVAGALGLEGPRGIGFEVDLGGVPDLSTYFRVPADTRALPNGATARLAAAAGLDAALADHIERDLRALYTGGTVGVIGVDNGLDGQTDALKFNPPNVALETAIEFLAAKGARPSRIADIVTVAHALRARWMSYLGVRYGAAGFAGWRVYLSVAPQRFPPPLAPRWAVEPDAIPTLMLPHF